MIHSRAPVRALVVIGVVLFAIACDRPDRPRDEDDLLALVNASRRAAGLAPLRVQTDLAGHARWHAARMAARGRVFHSDRIEAAARSAGWSRLGENVGVGGSTSGVHAAFMRSRPHRALILGDFTHVAIGAARDHAGRLFVATVFVKRIDRGVLLADLEDDSGSPDWPFSG